MPHFPKTPWTLEDDDFLLKNHDKLTNMLVL